MTDFHDNASFPYIWLTHNYGLLGPISETSQKQVVSESLQSHSWLQGHMITISMDISPK